MKFEKVNTGWNYSGTEHELFTFKTGQEVDVFNVKTIEALNALAGYAKYLNQDKKVYFRGQPELYPGLVPSLYRRSPVAVGARNTKIALYIKKYREGLNNLKKDMVPDSACEPLLQHYGIRTKWLDIVDNLFVALWFGLHSTKSNRFAKPSGRYYDLIVPRDDIEGYAYILLLASDASSDSDECHGLYKGDETSVIDLRVAVPSIFLRPHCQHGMLMRPRKCDSLDDVDLMKHVILAIEMRVKSALDWLGNGRMMTAENMYPSPFYDQGYALLLEQAPYDPDLAQVCGSANYVSYERPSLYPGTESKGPDPHTLTSSADGGGNNDNGNSGAGCASARRAAGPAPRFCPREGIRRGAARESEENEGPRLRPGPSSWRTRPRERSHAAGSRGIRRQNTGAAGHAPIRHQNQCAAVRRSAGLWPAADRRGCPPRVIYQRRLRGRLERLAVLERHYGAHRS